MDFLDSILNAMDAPPNTGEQQKQREYMERMKNKQREELARFRSYVQERMGRFAKDGRTSMEFQPFDRIHRTIIQEAAEYGGFMAMSFGRGEDIRQSVVYKKEHPPDADELYARRKGEGWNKEIARQYAERRKDRSKQEQDKCEQQVPAAAPSAIAADALPPATAAAAATAPASALAPAMAAPAEPSKFFGHTPSTRDHIANSNLVSKPVVSYRAKYAHLIAEPATLQSVRETSTNHSYGFVPSRFKRDNRSIEQTLADIQARKRLRMQQGQERLQPHQQLVQGQRKMKEPSMKDPSLEPEELKLDQPVLGEQQKLLKKRKVEEPRIQELALSDVSSDEEQLEQQTLVNRKVDKVTVVKEYGSNEDYSEKRQEINYPEEQFKQQHPVKRQETIEELGLSTGSSEEQLQQQKLTQMVEELPKELAFGKVEKVPRTKPSSNLEKQQKRKNKKVDQVPAVKALAMGKDSSKERTKKQKKVKRKLENVPGVSNSSEKHYPDLEETSRLALSEDSSEELHIAQENRVINFLGLNRVKEIALSEDSSEEEQQLEPDLKQVRQPTVSKGPSEVHTKRKKQKVKAPALRENSSEIIDPGQINKLALSEDLSKKRLKQPKLAKRKVKRVARTKELALGKESSKKHKLAGQAAILSRTNELALSEISSEEEHLEVQNLVKGQEMNYAALRQEKELVLSEESSEEEQQNLVKQMPDINYLELKNGKDLVLSEDSSEEEQQVVQQKPFNREVGRVPRDKELAWRQHSEDEQNEAQRLVENRQEVGDSRQMGKLASCRDSRNIEPQKLVKNRTIKELARSEDSSVEEQIGPKLKRQVLKQVEELALSEDSSEEEQLGRKLALSEGSSRESEEEILQVQNQNKWMIGPAGGSELELSEESSLESD
ncbi:trichohyalin-like [Drosophila virilis]|uniref:trichohyalin-like n=1 Tax=Drosophila virilis TaxID=7244 RepID=UPI00017D5653|nr:involucrin-like [Drosophila virilis]